MWESDNSCRPNEKPRYPKEQRGQCVGYVDWLSLCRELGFPKHLHHDVS